MAPPSALLLDFDGTLVDSMAVLRRVYDEFLGDRGRSPTQAEFEALVGWTLREIVERLRAAHGLGEPVSALVADYRARLVSAYATGLRSVPGADVLIRRARHAGLRLALVTSGDAAAAETVLGSLGWRGAFEAIVGGEHVATGKPDPALYREALARLGVAATEAIAIEDSPSGVRAAVGAGVRTLGLAGHAADDRARLRSAGAHEVVGSLYDAAARLPLMRA